MRPARLLGQALLALVLLVTPLAAQSRTVTPEETRRLAAQALLAGYPAHALELARALLALDAGDVAAGATASRAARAMGDSAAAQGFARQAWNAAESDKERYHAAIAMAQALASDDKRTRAQFWLRRAAQNAPTPQARASARRDFAYVRGRNPWRSSFTLGLSPSSNINNGSASERIDIGGLAFQLSGDARALSGTELSLGLTSEYRIRSGRRTILRFGGSLDARRYWLSDAARRQAPNADAADYAYRSIELTAGLTRAPRPRAPAARGPSFGLFDASLSLGKSWYGGTELLTYTRANLSQGFQLAPRTSGWVALTGEWQNRLDTPSRSLRSGTLSLGLAHAFETGRLTLATTLREVASDNPQVAYSARGLTASYALAQPLLKARTTLSAGYETRDYEAGFFSADRRDTRRSLGLSLFFTEADYYGFAPEVGLTWARNDSTNALYSTDTLGIAVGLKSTF